MNKPLVYRDNRLFRIDQEQLSAVAKRADIINALYAAIYLEFRGAHCNPKYSNLTYEQRLQKVNDFALKWLSDRNLR